MKIKRTLLLSGLILVMVCLGCKEKSDTSESADYTENKYPALEKKTHSTRTKVLSPKEELARFKVPEGFVVELIASEEDGIVNPIDLTFDDAGRLWTQTAEMYPLDPVADIKWQDLLRLMDNPEAQEKDPNFKRILDLYRGVTKGDDKILVLSGLYDDAPVQTKVRADGLTIPQSILPYKNGSYVAQGSELFFLEDTDNDGKADERTPLFTGFGFTDTHTMSHVLMRGPGDWIHFSQGALNKGEVSSTASDAKIRLDYSKIARFSLDAKKIELVSAGLNNIWGFQLRGNGQWYGTEANDLGFSIVPMEIGTGFKGIGNDRLRPYQPWMPELHEFRVGGTGISGLAFADDSDGSFPDEWKDVAFLANPITSTINAVKIKRNADGSVSAEHLPDFLTSEDDWFRPVNMEFGPDGSLYIADWYNKIVSHNELPTTHPDRDKAHGRIWRIRHESQNPREIPNFYEVKTEELVGFLQSPSLWAKRAAWHQISDRPLEKTKPLAKDLTALVSDRSQDETTRILALWSLEGIQHYDRQLMSALVKAKPDNLRREAIRALQSFSLDATELAQLLNDPLDDGNAMVRSQVLRTLDKADTANAETIALLIKACKPPLEGNSLGGAYERSFERYLARKALENYPGELSDFMESPRASNFEPSNLIWASQVLPKQEREKWFVDLWKKARYQEFDEPTFIIAAGMLDNKKVYDLVKPVFDSNEKAISNVSLALQHQARVQSDELTTLLAKPVRHLLRSKEASQQQLGLEAVGKLKVQGLRDAVLALTEGDPTEETLKLAMLALGDQPEANKMAFARIARNEILGLELRAAAIQNLAKANLSDAGRILSDWLPKLSETEQRAAVKMLSNSNEGATLLKQLLENGTVSSKAFNISSAEKILQADENDDRGKTLLEEVKERVEEERKAFDSKLERFMAIAEKGGGNAENGEQLFQVCLACHRVGTKGQEIAPALDGSATRENEALLTAILDPDAAVESSYAIYRVVKKDGSSLEGYLSKKDDRGTTLAFMGGSEQFVQAADIASQGFMAGRSLMPKGLIDNYSDEQVADLLAFIKTLR